MALVHRTYVAYSIDEGESFSAQLEVYSSTVDVRRVQTMHQPDRVNWDDRQHDIMWTMLGGVVKIANADFPPKPFVPKINKLNRKRTFGNEL